jgi:hypothetical protein
MSRLALLTVALIALAIPGTVAGEPPQDRGNYVVNDA